MALKTYSIRLDEEEYEKLKKFLAEYGDPDLNLNFLLRSYIRDLNRALPHLKSSELGIRVNLTFWGALLRHIEKFSQIDSLLRGESGTEKGNQDNVRATRDK